MDSRVETIYNIFKNICNDYNLNITRKEFDYQLMYQIQNNSILPRNLSLTEALDFAETQLTMSLSDIASFILDEIRFMNSWIQDEKGPTDPFLANFKFNNSRKSCLAPYSTINFDTSGIMRVCCYNSKFILGTYPTTSIIDAWNNPSRKEFIKKLEKLNFNLGCEKCRLLITTENMSGALFTKFDAFDNLIVDMPINFEFEFGTICNYECIMCGGKWSSSIRKNREKLPPIVSPYDDNFIQQLKPFIPYMRVTNFLGGEPFLTPLYYKIWDLFIEINKNINVYITTNGSIFNERVESYLNKLPNSSIVVSLDSLKKDTYEFIRRRGNFDTVMTNIKKIISLKKLSSIAFCPIIQNVYELPDIVKFCDDNNIGLYINTVIDPLGGRLKGIHKGEKYKNSVWIGREDLPPERITHENEELIPEFCLQTLPKEEIMKIINFLTKYDFSSKPCLNSKYVDFIAYLSNLVNNFV